MATVYCGVDFDARQQTVSYLTTEAGEMHHHELAHDLDQVQSFSVIHIESTAAARACDFAPLSAPAPLPEIWIPTNPSAWVHHL